MSVVAVCVWRSRDLDVGRIPVFANCSSVDDFNVPLQALMVVLRLSFGISL